MATTSYHQPYVEDFDSVVGEVIPLTARRQTSVRKNSSLAQCSNMDEGVSDSGYSSQSVSSTPIIETPPPQTQRERQTPAPEYDTEHERYREYREQYREDYLEDSPSPAHGTIRNQSSRNGPTTRPRSKSFSRSTTPAAPRNIPGKNTREDSPTSSTGGSSDCDCPDCKQPASKPSPNSPSILTGAWPINTSYSSSYGHSSQWPGYSYSKYEGYSNSTDSGVSDLSRGSGSDSWSGSKRSSVPPPPRPQSSFAGSSSHAPSNSWSSSGYGGSYYAPPSHSSSPVPPAPSLTTPPYAVSMYPPPPINTAPPAPSPQPTHSSYAPPPVPSYYTYPHDYYGTNSAASPEPAYPTAADYALPKSSSSNRRHSMRAQANAGAAVQDVPIEYSHSPPHHPHRRLSNRVEAASERPASWYHGQPQYHELPNRSISVPPVDSNAIPMTESRRRMATPQPIRRRESTREREREREREHFTRLGPSSLSKSMEASSLARSMESCAISDDSSPCRGHYSHRHNDSHYGSLSRREVMYPREPAEELVSLTVVDSDEPFTMTYPAGVKLQVNGAYKHVQQRQQQVHAQLAGQYDYDRRANEEYYHRPSTRPRRGSMSGY
ncbi:hypothetical protein RUND412_003423 [Rhizina undulata]